MEEYTDIFTHDIFQGIRPPSSSMFSLNGVTLPANQDIYFVSKWHELHDRYASARIFLRKTQEDDFAYWFNKVDDPQAQKGIEQMFRAEFFETALINYNILVDLSWTWTYVSAEYVLYSFDADGNVTNTQDVSGMHPIDEAYELLRKTENGVPTPHAEGNPFAYLKKMSPEFSQALDTIIDFWRTFSCSKTRNLYNFIKHKGKPRYKEVEELRGGKLWSLSMEGKEYPTDIRDVQMIIGLDDSIQELIDFDNEYLYPYFERLLNCLQTAVDPSPMVF